MNNILIFSLISIGFLPVGVLIVHFFYKNTILFPIIVIVFCSAVFCSLVSFIIGDMGFKVLIWIAPLCIVGLLLLNYTVKRIIQKPLLQLKSNIDKSAVGILNLDIDHKILNKKDEIGSIAKSFSTLLNTLNNTAEFSNEIGKGNFEIEYKLLGEQDKMGIALLNMRDNLVEVKKKDEIRKLKEKEDNWANQGIAKFSDILRNDSNNIGSLSKNFVVNLVNYIGAVQGGLFVINEENADKITYDLIFSVAYNREKTLQKSFGVGESLVGRCAYEKLPIYLTEVPEDYVHITSGLGTSNPRCILLIPAILNNKVFAIIEIVAFKTFEEYVIKFVNSIAEDLASTIANTKINETTQKLLEETQHQRESLAAQEEEMRQNLEELQATQEEMKRKELELMEINDNLQKKLEAVT